MALVSAVVFDLDGTLFDHPGSARRGLEAWLAELDVVLTDELATAWFDAETRHFTAWRQGRVTFADHRRRRLQEFLPLIGRRAESDEDLDVQFTGYLAAYERSWVGYADVEAALDAVHDLGMTTAVLTNGTEEQQTAKLSSLGLLHRVGPVFTAERLGVAKPHPEAFRHVCTELGVPPEHVLYVGDDHELDVLAARAAGLRAIHLDRDGLGPMGEQDRATTLHDLGVHVAGLRTASDGQRSADRRSEQTPYDVVTVAPLSLEPRGGRGWPSTGRGRQ